MVKLAQLVRASDCGSEGHGFETHISPHKKANEHHIRFFRYCLNTFICLTLHKA